MVKIISEFFLVILLVILQMTIFNKFAIFGAVPNLILIIAICFVLKQRFNLSIIIAGFGGLILDLVSPMYFGIYTLSGLIIIYFVNYFLIKISESPNRWALFFVFTISLFFSDVVVLLITKTWPGWHLISVSFINGLWGSMIYILIENLFPPNEEINIA